MLQPLLENIKLAGKKTHEGQTVKIIFPQHWRHRKKCFMTLKPDCHRSSVLKNPCQIS